VGRRHRAASSVIPLSVVLVLSALGTARAGSDGTGQPTSWGSFYVSYESTPEPIPFNEVFNLIVTVRDGTDRSKPIGDCSIDVIATMPAHHHGMNLRPRVTSLGDGRFRVDGMLLHMPGRWQIQIDVNRHTVTERAVFDVPVR